MAGFANYLEYALLDHTFKIGAYTVPTNLYVGLSTADPTEDGSGLAEPVGNNYSRVNHNVWERALNEISNTGSVTFPTASGSWGTITHFGIFDASSGGNLLMSSTVSPSQAVVNGNTAVFADGALTCTLD